MNQDLIRHSPGAALVPDDAWGNPTATGSYTPGTPPAAQAMNTPMQRLHRVLRGRYFAAIVLGLTGALVGAAWGYLTPTKVYRSTGLLEISPVIPTLVRDTAIANYNSYMNNVAARLRINDAVEDARKQSVWLETPGTGNIGVAEFQTRLTSKFQRDSYQIQVSFEHPSDKVAEAGVKSVLEAFKRTHAERSDGSIKNRITLLTEQIDSLRSQELDLQEKINERISKYPTDDIATELTRINDRRQVVQEELTRLTFNYEAAKRHAAENANKASVINVPLLAQADSELAGLIQQRAQAWSQVQQDIARLGNGHPSVTAGQTRVQSLTSQINARAGVVSKAVGSAMSMPDGTGMVFVTPALLEDMERQIAFRQNLLNDLNPQLATMTQDRREINTFSLEMKRLNDQRLGFERTRENMELDASLGGGELKTAVLGDKPTIVQDDRSKMATVGAVLGAGIPIGLLVLFGLMDSRYRFSDEANEDGGMTLLGILPNLPDRLSDPAQASIAAHCVHQIRTMLQLSSIREGEPACFAVTSASSGDGKTSLTLALGLSFAASGSRTLLIDTDLVGGGLSSRLEVAGGEGVLEAVTSRQLLPYVQDTDVTDLSLLPVGAAQLHHAGNFSPSAVRRIIEQAKKHFDIVLIDTGPLLGAIESTPVCAAADGVLLTVARGQNRPLVDKALAHLRGIGATVAGVVFNKARSSDFEQSINGMSLQSQHRSANGQRKAAVGALPTR